MTAKEKAYWLIEEIGFSFQIGDNLSFKKDSIDAAKRCVGVILSLSGLPQYQIVFWREVLEELNKI